MRVPRRPSQSVQVTLSWHWFLRCPHFEQTSSLLRFRWGRDPCGVFATLIGAVSAVWPEYAGPCYRAQDGIGYGCHRE